MVALAAGMCARNTTFSPFWQIMQSDVLASDGKNSVTFGRVWQGGKAPSPLNTHTRFWQRWQGSKNGPFGSFWQPLAPGHL